MTTYFAAQHIDGGVVLTVTDFADGYRLRISDPRGTEIVAFPAATPEQAIDAAVALLDGDL